MQITIKQIMGEIDRELQVRRRVFPKWVETKKLIQSEADHRIATLQALQSVLKIFEVEHPLFSVEVDPT